MLRLIQNHFKENFKDDSRTTNYSSIQLGTTQPQLVCPTITPNIVLDPDPDSPLSTSAPPASLPWCPIGPTPLTTRPRRPGSAFSMITHCLNPGSILFSIEEVIQVMRELMK